MTGHSLITLTHRSIRRYYESVAALRDQGVLNEMSVRSPFESLLQETARLKDWTCIAELSGKSGGAVIRPDGTLRDRNSLPRGHWEAKDTQDDLDTEIKKKIARGYPLSNIIFEDTQTGVLFQGKQKINGLATGVLTFEPQRGGLSQPRPTAWVRKPNPFQTASPKGAR